MQEDVEVMWKGMTRIEPWGVPKNVRRPGVTDVLKFSSLFSVHYIIIDLLLQ